MQQCRGSKKGFTEVYIGLYKAIYICQVLPSVEGIDNSIAYAIMTLEVQTAVKIQKRGIDETFHHKKNRRGWGVVPISI